MHFSIFSPEKQETIQEQQAPQTTTPTSDKENKDVPNSPYNWTNLPETNPIMGCVANQKTSQCMCFGSNGATLHLSYAQCLSVIHNPLPRSIFISKKSN